MLTRQVTPEDLKGVFPVPPLARKNDARRTIDFAENDKIARHMIEGGMTRFLYGGNAFLYHITLAEYEPLLDWLTGFEGDHIVIPSAGPSFGRAMDQAPLLRQRGFPLVMLLPCADPRDAEGLERGMREFADSVGSRLVVYLKDESNMGSNKDAGLDAVARLVRDGVCAAIKYAVVREDPSVDAYLDGLLKRVDRRFVISGIGERPAVKHMRDFRLPGFTTGSGCVAPKLSNALFQACSRGEFEDGESIRRNFLPLEDLRDAWGPARVLHHATELAGIAPTGPIPPYVSALSAKQLDELGPVSRALVEADRPAAVAPAVVR